MVKKKVNAVATSVLSTEAFPTVGLPLQLEMPMGQYPCLEGREGVLELWHV
jgi:hypothetical protein